MRRVSFFVAGIRMLFSEASQIEKPSQSGRKRLALTSLLKY
jgi:hypothetical protein